jgi:serine/threonine-protein kinase
MLGRIVDERYKLVRLLGTGGMGNVYEAVHQGTGRRVALKVIANTELANDSGAIARFEREAKAAGNIETPHIAEVFDAGTDRATRMPYIAMEFLVGDDLKEVTARLGALDVHLSLRIVAQACSGLQKAHDAGIVHRDIKPANLFLARQADGPILVKVLDFGIAKLPSKLLSGADALTATTTGRLLGSPLFMSPEQVRGLRTLDHRTDIWSLGAVLYQALAGRPPFAECETVGQLMLAICSQRPPPLEQVAPWVRPEVAAVVDCALQIDPDGRFSSAEAMRTAILALLPSGIEIDESQLMSASGQRITTFGSNDRSVAGTQSLEEGGLFLVEPPSSRQDKPRTSKPASPRQDSSSTMPSASDGRPRSSGAPVRRRPWLTSLALLSLAFLGAGIWLVSRQGTTATPGLVEPASDEARTPKGFADLDAEPRAAVEAPTGHDEPSAPRPVDLGKHRVKSASEQKRPASSPSSTSPLGAIQQPSAITPAEAASVPAEPRAEVTPAVSASVGPPPPESPWRLERQFKKGSP